MKVRVAIVGATGYTGAELVRLLTFHPTLELRQVVGRSEVGRPLAELFPQLHATRFSSLRITAFEPDRLAAEADLVFLALPHGAAAEHAEALVQRGVRVVDLSADFRLKDEAAFRAFYGEPHATALWPQAVYGLPELHRALLPGAKLIAAPGCYVTATVLACAGLFRAGLADPAAGIIADCKSGVSGAGRSAAVGSLFAEVGESISAYKIDAHRHRPEIEQELAFLAGRRVRLTFVPHLVPMSRGILATIYAEPTAKGASLDTAGLVAALADSFAGEPFVKVLPAGQLPSTVHVRGSNVCVIGAAVDPHAQRLVVVAAIDNLVKGASGQAIQAANVALGLPETAGLELPPLFP